MGYGAHQAMGYGQGQGEGGYRQKCSFDPKTLDVKYAMDPRHQFDGNEKAGETWKTNVNIFLTGRILALKQLLKWAEDHGDGEVTTADVESLRYYMEEDPVVISHLLWAFMGVNLTGAALAIFGNVEGGQRARSLETAPQAHLLEERVAPRRAVPRGA